MPRIGLLAYTSHNWAQSILNGVGQFIREHEDWVPIPCGQIAPIERGFVEGLELDGLLGFYPNEALKAGFVNMPPYVTWSGVPPMPGTAQVITDNRLCGEIAAQHLYERGYRTLGCFENQNPNRIGAKLREQGFEKFAETAGCDHHLFRNGPHTKEQWSLHGQIADLADWLDGLPKPVGVVCSDDNHSWRILEAAQRVGLWVPDDVGIVGQRNDAYFCESTQPTLSSVAVDNFGQGYESCVLLQKLMAGEPAPSGPVLIPPLGVIGRESSGVSVSQDPEISSALHFIREHLADDIGVADVASHIGVARRTAQRLFMDVLGRSPSEEIRRARLEKALDLLRGTEMPMVEITVEAGFSHTSQLSRAVKQSTGLSPSRYRTRFGVPE